MVKKENCRNKTELVIQWGHGVVVITTGELHSTKPELRFCAAQAQTLLAACRRFAIVRISDNGPSVFTVNRGSKNIVFSENFNI